MSSLPRLQGGLTGLRPHAVWIGLAGVLLHTACDGGKGRPTYGPGPAPPAMGAGLPATGPPSPFPTVLVAPRILGTVPFDPQRAHGRDFEPTGVWLQLSDSLYLWRDTCNVYVVKVGDQATLIDFGSGAVREHLSEIGVSRIAQVLVTHHHRDQIQGLVGLEPREFHVAVPRGEAHLIETAADFWANVRIHLNYDLRSHFNSVRHNVRVDHRVGHGDLLDWSGLRFQVLETPGHTGQSVSYAAAIDGRRVVFSGDLIAGPGKVHNWFDLHWDYYGFTQGIDASETSFGRILREQPDWLLPSHGQPISNVGDAFERNRAVHRVLRDLLPPNQLRRRYGEMRAISPHLIHLGGLPGQPTGTLTGYAILSDSRKALLYDYGYADLQQVERLQREFGVKTIDAVTFSHYHDDHIIRAYELRRDHRPEFWVFENMVDIFKYPTRYRLPCLVPFPIQPDRILTDGEKVRWEEYELEFFHMPGQTEFHQGLVVDIDGRKVMFTGDNTWNKRDPDRLRNGPLVPQNEYFLDGGFITCARLMLRHMPDLVCPAHTEEYSPDRRDLEGFLDWALRLRDTMTGYIDQPDPNFGMDYRWCHFYPYRSCPSDPAPFPLELRLRNHLFRPATVQVRLQLHDDIQAEPSAVSFVVPAKTAVAVDFRLRRLAGYGIRRVVTADIVINGHHLGEVAEALVD
ncbi:MAG: hypothetical protein Kow001_21860 [Acidobacteriota bacterium]